MSSLNRATLLGRLGADPEVRTFQNGNRVVNFRLATSERWKDREGNQKEVTQWHSIAIFNEKLGEIAERYLKKGSLALVEGQIETRKWQAQDGTDRYSTEIVIRNFGGQLVLMPNGDRDGGSRSSSSDDRGGGWDSPRGGGAQGGSTYRHPAAGHKTGRDLDDSDIPF